MKPGSDMENKTATTSSASQTAFPQPRQFSNKLEERAFLKFRLAQAFRLFGEFGFDEGVAGHITVRDPIKPDCFWVNPFGKHFVLIQPEDLLLVSHDGVILDESGPQRLLNTAAFQIHSAIHSARPDVLCAAHSHSIFGRAFSTLGRELEMITQDACKFYNDCAIYTNFRGVVLDEEEGRNIANAIGDKKAVILQNHGLLVATTATLYYFLALEKCCEVQLLADAGGYGKTPIKINNEEAAATGKQIGTMRNGWFSGLPQFESLEAREGVRFDWQG
ncbi:arad-like aldolase/epimerase [Schizopora paradoxa]|uniref:Arad-like aldolase/epimerase n=1 Tax=Schizopora paradoxa TaxID=27342 RepID=A0A0H2RXC2_9AGAM|nr:arad-like aldolase/epimerase [Schizopora paradoxa]